MEKQRNVETKRQTRKGNGENREKKKKEADKLGNKETEK
jgi:hypothetical protein